MSITRLFNKTVSTQRLSNSGSSHKETWSTNLATLQCAIHPAGAEQQELIAGGFFKGYKLWCAVDTDIEIGDRVIDGSTTYTVKGVAKYDFGNDANQHKSVLIVEGV